MSLSSNFRIGWLSRRTMTMYNSTKLIKAISAWIKADCQEGFGQTYAGSLFQSFEAYLERTSALKSSPGRIAFGRELAGLKRFEKKQIGGLTHWTGIVLKAPATVVPLRQAKTIKKLTQRATVRTKQLKSSPKKRAAEQKSRLKEVRKRMKAESAKHSLDVGSQDAP